MKKYYRINGETIRFENVHMEAGMLCGVCTNTGKHFGKEAWLDPHGFQFDGEHRVEALEIAEPATLQVPHGCHYWGGQIRSNFGRTA